MTTVPTSSTDNPGPLPAVLARWPTLVGLAALIATSAGGVDAHLAATIIMIAALCYLAAAAAGRPAAAWLTIPAGVALVTLGMLTALDAVLLLVLAAAALVIFGLVRRPRSGWPELGLQAAGFAGFTTLGLVAMMVDPVLAAHLAALAAIGHGVWDLVHHRRNRVVGRSLAEFCAVLDLGLGTVILIVTWLAR
ncbi:hypothetical protein [Microlunatus parietis]|uniref:Uncharacterized protein n=1 Tax=Microlunatus parietis TaxID=682979 RepID=A0A7Y9I4M5_9ACTN|nr:hypothetical protein [Microlunatus parietis]NYE70164.1 hypothetical protein [Microlunatus parietis]